MSRQPNFMFFVLFFFMLCMFGCGNLGGTTTNGPVIVAKAGLAQNVVAGNIVSLDGSQSTDIYNNSIIYQWSLISTPDGSVAAISNPNIVNPTFRADLPGLYSVKLIVTDAKSNTSEDSITVTVTAAGNVVPVANAGAVRNVVTGAVVTLDGSNSSAANGQPLTYLWTFTSKPDGSLATLSGATLAKPTFTADLTGSYTLDLIVNNGVFSSTAATVTVTAAPLGAINIAPLNSTLGMGQVYQFIATAILATGGSNDISNSVSWTSSNTAVATINSSGLVTAIGPGTTIISATVAGQSASTTLVVGTATPVGLKVDNGIAYTLSPNQSLQLTATATYTDKTKDDITQLASWTPRYANFPVNCLTVSNTPGTKGIVSTMGQACYEQVVVSYGGIQTLISISVK